MNRGRSAPFKEPVDETDRKQARATLQQTWSSVKHHLRLKSEGADEADDADDSDNTGDATGAHVRDNESGQQTDEIDPHTTPNS